MAKYLYPTPPVQCIITRSSDCGKSFFLTNPILNITIEYEKIYTYSQGLYQDSS